MQEGAQLLALRMICPACSQITALAFSPDGQTLLSGSEDGSMAAWDLGSARRLASMHSHRSAVWSLAFSHGAGSVLASGGLMHVAGICKRHLQT